MAKRRGPQRFSLLDEFLGLFGALMLFKYPTQGSARFRRLIESGFVEFHPYAFLSDRRASNAKVTF